MSKRFHYQKMTGREFSAALDRLGMKPKAFARVFGLNWSTVLRWVRPPDAPDALTVPTWVPVALTLLELPHALGRARQVAAERITRDGRTGEAFPFLDLEEDDET